MTPQHPAAPEGETDASGRLTDAEWDDLRSENLDDLGPELRAAVERILAERLRVVEGERDEWERLHGQQMTALDYWIKVYADLHEEWGREVRHCEHATARAESAEAAQPAGREGDARALVAALKERWDGLPGRLAPHVALDDVRQELRALLAGGGA